MNWHDSVFFGIHYDLHAGANDTALGAELTAEHLRQRLLMIKPDWIQCDCKGHPGYTSWPTQVGSTSPGVVRDSLRIHRDVTRELGIRLGMHYSGVWDDRAVELHPEWTAIQVDGKPYAHATCLLSDYTEQLMIPQMIELIDRYDVDGFWVDGECWAARICYCPRCRAEFTRRTGLKRIPRKVGQRHWDDWFAFHRDLFVEHVTQYTQAIHSHKASVLVCSNWMYTVRQPESVKAPVDYLSGDFDPAWGANRAAVEGRLLDAQKRNSGRSWDLMAWGFVKAGEWGDDIGWVMKPALHLCQEISEVLALGGAAMIYENPQRTGWLTGWHQEVMAEVAEFCRARQAVCFQTETVPQAAVLHLKSHFYPHSDPLYNYGIGVRAVEGALHALLETNRSADLLTEDSAPVEMGKYPLVIVPEQTHLTAEMQAAIFAYTQAGGVALLTGAHLAEECPGLVGVQPAEAGSPETTARQPDPFYLPVDGKAVIVTNAWRTVTPLQSTQTLVTAQKQQEPGKDDTHLPVVTSRKIGRGAVIAVHGALFESYFRAHYPLLRRFIANLIENLTQTFAVPWRVRLEASPRLEMVLRKKEAQLRINLINRGAAETLNSQRVVLEELLPVENILLKVKLERTPLSVSAPLEETPIEWQWQDGLLTIRVGKVSIHNVVVVEQAV